MQAKEFKHMIIVIAKQQVKEGKLEEFMEQAKPLIAAARMEKGNISYQLIKETTSVTSVSFLEKWENKEVLDAHMKTEHFVTILPKLSALTEGKMEISVNEILI